MKTHLVAFLKLISSIWTPGLVCAPPFSTPPRLQDVAVGKLPSSQLLPTSNHKAQENALSDDSLVKALPFWLNHRRQFNKKFSLQHSGIFYFSLIWQFWVFCKAFCKHHHQVQFQAKISVIHITPSFGATFFFWGIVGSWGGALGEAVSTHPATGCRTRALQDNACLWGAVVGFSPDKWIITLARSCSTEIGQPQEQALPSPIWHQKHPRGRGDAYRILVQGPLNSLTTAFLCLCLLKREMFLKSAPLVFPVLDIGVCPRVVRYFLHLYLLSLCWGSLGVALVPDLTKWEREVRPEHGFAFFKSDSEAKKQPQAVLAQAAQLWGL